MARHGCNDREATVQPLQSDATATHTCTRKPHSIRAPVEREHQCLQNAQDNMSLSTHHYATLLLPNVAKLDHSSCLAHHTCLVSLCVCVCVLLPVCRGICKCSASQSHTTVGIPWQKKCSGIVDNVSMVYGVYCVYCVISLSGQ